MFEGLYKMCKICLARWRYDVQNYLVVLADRQLYDIIMSALPIRSIIFFFKDFDDPHCTVAQTIVTEAGRYLLFE
jgi:hypothetical protein